MKCMRKVCQLLKKRLLDETKKTGKLKNGDIVLAAITSCTNTANPYLMIAAALLAKKAFELGLLRKVGLKPHSHQEAR